ncbi:MAG: hypothetical protein V3S06_05895 [candidate division Zixibacteria bacterium]
MERLKEILISDLSVKHPHGRIDFLVNQINKNIRPPRKAAPDNVNIRVMYLLNDLVNSHGGRFKRDDLASLSRLIIDTPVLIGHDRSSVPLARTFHAELEQKGEMLWLKSYFYWPKSNDGVSDQLLDKIDSGILKECSISFIYTTPECSDCGQDIRNCPHEANANNGTHFIYKGITQVLETSLVSKGSVRGTYVTDKLSAHSVKSVTIGKGGYVTEFSVAYSMIPRSIAAVISLESRIDPMPEIIAHSPEIAAALAIKNGRVHLLVKSA